MTTTNGGQGQEPSPDQLPQLSVVGQYIKDFSFENPNAPKSLISAQEAPPMSDTDIEVVLMVSGKAEVAGSLMFNFELAFGGVFRIRNVPPESLNAVVLIECPRLLFPFAREIIATTVRNGGFPPLLLDPVDFVALYRQKMAQMPAAEAPAQ
jgi:preprotein translocase subunit SecB